MFVKLKEGHGFPRKHTVLGIRFLAGKWKTDIDESRKEFFENYTAEKSNKKLFIVADSPESAAQAIIDARQKKLSKTPALKEGKVYTDDDLLTYIQVQDMQKRSEQVTPVASVAEKPIEPVKQEHAPVQRKSVKPSPEERSGNLLVALTKVVGPVVAGRLASRFGDDLFAVITETPNKLSGVDGIGKKKKQKIVKAVRGMG